MRYVVMTGGDAQLRVCLGAEVARHHEREDATQVGLVRHRGTVEHQGRVVTIRLWNANRRIERRDFSAVLRFHALDPPLDLPDIVEVLTQAHAVARTEPALEPGDIFGDRVENALILLHPRPTLSSGPGPAEQPLEYHSWVDLHRQRRRWRRP